MRTLQIFKKRNVLISIEKVINKDNSNFQISVLKLKKEGINDRV